MDDLDQCRKTNRALHRRVQQLEGPLQAEMVRVKSQADAWFGQWEYAIREKERLTDWLFVLGGLVTLLVLITGILVGALIWMK